LTGAESVFNLKVYYEDTDCMSVVYHANYVKFLERARTEYLAQRLDSIDLYHERGFYFMVHKLEMAFHGSARLGDNLAIRTVVENTTRFRVVVKQIISRQGEPNDYLVTATVTLVTVDPSGKLIPVPDEFHSL
jgi:tol-pal system-associated acyl-CoA thioesterase